MTTLSKCKSCTFFINPEMCDNISCHTFTIKQYGMILDFNHFYKFVPKFGSDMQPVVFEGKTYQEVEDFLYNIFINLKKKGH